MLFVNNYDIWQSFETITDSKSDKYNVEHALGVHCRYPFPSLAFCTSRLWRL